MARGHWRNWDETKCDDCGNPVYVKYSKKYKGRRLCQSCYKKAKRQEGRGWHEPADHTGKAPMHKIAASKHKLDRVIRKPIQRQDRTTKFKRDVSRFLAYLTKNNPYDTTATEFRRWLKEDLMPFDQKAADEQINEKIDYETDIGNNSDVFYRIKDFMEKWVDKNVGALKESNIWYHGTTESKYRQIVADGEIKVSTAETTQHKDFIQDIGTVSLAKYKGMAHFFSAISGRINENKVVLHIDISKFDPSAIEKRKLMFTQDGQILYHKNIPITAIIKAETVYTAKKE